MAFRALIHVALLIGVMSKVYVLYGEQPGELDRLIERLSHKENNVRINAVIEIGNWWGGKDTLDRIEDKKKAVDALISMLNDRYHGVRKNSVLSLAVIDGQEAAPVFRAKLLREKNAQVQIAIITALGQFQDTESEEQFLLIFESSSLPLRIAALRALARLRSDTADRKVIHGLNDPVESIRVVAAELCSANHLYDAVPFLRENVSHEVPEVRISAVTALGAMGDREELKFLKSIKNHEKNQDVLTAIDRAVENISTKMK